MITNCLPRSVCRGCGGCSFPGTPALTRRPRKIGAKEDGDDGHLSRRPEAAEASTAAPRRITRTPTHGYEPTREAAMAAFARSLAKQVRSTFGGKPENISSF